MKSIFVENGRISGKLIERLSFFWSWRHFLDTSRLTKILEGAMTIGEYLQTCKLKLSIRARLMYRHTDIYLPIWRCCWCIVSANFSQYISAILVHKSVTLLFCMERSETL